MERRNVGPGVIVEGNRPVGIVSDRNIALQVAARGVALHTPVSQVISAPVKTVERDDGVFDATQTMRDAGVRRLPAVDDDGP